MLVKTEPNIYFKNEKEIIKKLNKMKVYLVRHAESNIESLTKNGEKQSIKLAKKIKSVDTIIISKYKRTLDTAKPLLEKFNLNPILWDEIFGFKRFYDNDLNEFSYINYEKFKNTNDKKRLINEYWEKMNPFSKDEENTESFYDFVNRVYRIILKIKEIKNTTYIFTHGNFIRLFLILNDKLKNNTFSNIDITDLMIEFYKDVLKINNIYIYPFL